MFQSSGNPPNRFDPRAVEWEGPPPRQDLKVVLDDTRGILAHNESPDVGFSWSVNPYRGCTHACAYCYARPSHEYLGFGAGEDFERRIVVKRRAPELLAEAFEKPSWKGEPVAFSGVTDCYQALERRYGLTRGCLEVCRDYRNPVMVVTRSPLVTRDVGLLADLAAVGAASVTLSVPIPDDPVARALEPGAPPPSARIEAIRVLAAAGVPVGVSVSPVIPGLTDRTLPRALQLAREAGARWAWTIDLRLPGAVAVVFEARLRAAFPDRAPGILDRIRRARGGRLNDPSFGTRMKGDGEEAEVVHRLFALWHRKLGFESPPPSPDPSPFRRPGQGAQLPLFRGAGRSP